MITVAPMMTPVIFEVGGDVVMEEEVGNEVVVVDDEGLLVLLLSCLLVVRSGRFVAVLDSFVVVPLLKSILRGSRHKNATIITIIE